MRFTFRLLSGLVLGLAANVHADAIKDMTAFSVFDQVTLPDLASSGPKTLRGVPMSNPRYLSVQTCYVLNGTPAQVSAALRRWNPERYSESKVALHSELPGSPGPGNFARLRNSNKSPAQTLAAATEKMGQDLQISNEEAKKFTPQPNAVNPTMSGPIANFWIDLLAARARTFSSGGIGSQAAYSHTGQAIRPSQEINGLLGQQEKIKRQFSGLIGGSRAELYWELLDAEDQGVLTLGASYMRPGAGGTYQAADVLYYASSSYYASLTFQQLWPTTVNGKPATLVWRGDMVSASSLESLHGVERLASEAVMMKDISRSVNLFRRDSGGSR